MWGKWGCKGNEKLGTNRKTALWMKKDVFENVRTLSMSPYRERTASIDVEFANPRHSEINDGGVAGRGAPSRA